MKTSQQIDQLDARRTYVVVLAADDGRRAYCYVYAASADRAKELACAAELAPPDAVLSVRVSDFEEAQQPTRMPSFVDSHVLVVRPDTTGTGRAN